MIGDRRLLWSRTNGKDGWREMIDGIGVSLGSLGSRSGHRGIVCVCCLLSGSSVNPQSLQCWQASPNRPPEPPVDSTSKPPSRSPTRRASPNRPSTRQASPSRSPNRQANKPQLLKCVVADASPSRAERDRNDRPDIITQLQVAKPHEPQSLTRQPPQGTGLRDDCNKPQCEQHREARGAWSDPRPTGHRSGAGT